MSARPAVAGTARRLYRGALKLHAATRAGYAPQMLATFEQLLAGAVTRGNWAVIALVARECAGLITYRRAPSGRRPFMTNILQDLRFAVRTFRRRPAFTAALVATLALGIGANTAIFSATNAILFGRLPLKDPARLVMVWEEASALGFPHNTPAPGNYADWTTAIASLDGVTALDLTSFNLTAEGDPERIDGARVTPNFFSVLGVEPALGRSWRADEDLPGNAVAVIGHDLWIRRFGGDPGILQRKVLLNDTPYTILGVMPERFEILDPGIQLFSPRAFTQAELQDRGNHYLAVVGRLRDGHVLDQANAELQGLAERLRVDQPTTNGRLGMFAVPLLESYVGNTRSALVVLLAAVGCVLLIACANVANLLLTHAAGRSREMAVRTALGADRRRLVRQLLTESLLLSIAGGVLGIAVAMQSFGVLTLMIPQALSGLSAIRLDARVLLITGALSAVTSLLFGAAPAWRASRVDLGMSAAHRSTRGVIGGGSRIRSGLVVAEIALATMLMVGAGLLIQSFRSAQTIDLGFRPANVLTMRAQLPRRAYADPARRTQFVDAVLERVRALPGVQSAGITSAAPFLWKGGSTGFTPEGQPRIPSLPYDATNRTVSAGYMEAIGMTLRAGRFFDAHDTPGAESVGIINETMARLYWPGQDALGRRFRFGGSSAPPRVIVGIVADTRVMGIERPTRPEMYFPIPQAGDNWMWPRDLVIHATGDPRALIQAASAAIWSVDRTQPVSNIAPMEEIVSRELRDRRLQTTLMSVFAMLALFLAAIGIYGVLSYMVTERTAEIGVRLALGGDPRRIRFMVIRRGLGLAVLGLSIGLLAAFWGTAALQQLLFNVRARDLATFALQALVLLVVCVGATYFPARRASNVDPMRALRMD